MTSEPTLRGRLESVLNALLTSSPEYSSQSLMRSDIERYASLALSMPIFDDNVSVDELVSWAEMRFNVRQEEAAVLRGDDALHQDWLEARLGDLYPSNGFWNHYRRMLEERLPPVPLAQLDRVTNRILGELESPQRELQWDRRGLVMGHVQSGKTANYIGLMAKAMDAGYKLIIVMAGVHSNLRAQTQSRIDEGIVGVDTRFGARSIGKVGVGLMPGHPSVFTMTSASDAGDFKKAVASGVGNPFSQSDVPTVFVIKKHVSVLEHLHDWLAENSHRPPGHERISRTPVLVIDDEADNASINTARDLEDELETDPTRTNAGIRRILELFEQSAYVGYTATPFANVFIDDEATHTELGDDLFPRDFIFALEAPSNYVGPKQVFGLKVPASSEAKEDLGLPMVTQVFDNLDWLPMKQKADVKPDPQAFPASLKDAIRGFVLTCAARRLRGQTGAHNSMLVHVTRFVSAQAAVAQQVEEFLSVLSQSLLYDVSSPEWEILEAIWTRDYVPVALALAGEEDAPPVHEFADLRAHVPQVVQGIDVREVNGTSDDLLDYYNYTDGLSVIAIGGAKLSRGLTLEGLSVSYYLRDTRMYDTLMQMGRWFGYRPGYLDLCRVHTTPDVVDWYRSIASATEELLADFRAMAAAGQRPKQFGLRVQLSPGMMITSQARMRSGVMQKVNFGGRRPEVTTFDVEVERRNLSLGVLDSFLEGLPSDPLPVKPESKDRIWRDVPGRSISSYFRDLQARGLYPNSVSARPAYLAEYVEKRMESGGLVSWTVLLKSTRSEDTEVLPLSNLSVGLARRTDRAGADRYAIKSLIGSIDESVDLAPDILAELQAADESASGQAFRERRPTTDGLLILYLLNGKAVVTKAHGNAPDIAEHIPDGPPFAAFCVSFPNDPDPKNHAVSYRVNSVFDRSMRSA